MDSQSFAIFLIILVFGGSALLALLQYTNAKEKEKKAKHKVASIQANLKSDKIKKSEKSLYKDHRPVEIVIPKNRSSYKNSPTIKSKTNELDKLTSSSEANLVFIDTETSSLDNPYVIDIALVDVYGAVLLSSKVKFQGEISKQAQAIHGILTTNKSCYPSPLDLEEELLSVLRGKTIVAFNVEFDLKALKNSFKSDRMLSLFETSKTICMMTSLQELFRLHKRKSLVNACDHLSIEVLPAHIAKNDALMLHSIYNKIKPIALAKDWMVGFEDICLKNLNLPDGTELTYWSSPDKERQILYSPKSSMGNGKVAELNEKLKLDLKQFGEVSFIVKYNKGIPDISIHTLSLKETKDKYASIGQQVRDEYKSKLLNPKMPTKGKLRFSLTLDCIEANRKRVPAILESEIYRPYVKKGDVLTIMKLTYKDDFNFREVQFIDLTGQSCGNLLNINDNWVRVFGILMKGYRADVHVVDASKRLKVDVFFIKAE